MEGTAVGERSEDGDEWRKEGDGRLKTWVGSGSGF
jgi:hypothetical protein